MIFWERLPLLKSSMVTVPFYVMLPAADSDSLRDSSTPTGTRPLPGTDGAASGSTSEAAANAGSCGGFLAAPHEPAHSGSANLFLSLP